MNLAAICMTAKTHIKNKWAVPYMGQSIYFLYKFSSLSDHLKNLYLLGMDQYGV